MESNIVPLRIGIHYTCYIKSDSHVIEVKYCDRYVYIERDCV